jgi:hypothetical protein
MSAENLEKAPEVHQVFPLQITAMVIIIFFTKQW